MQPARPDGWESMDFTSWAGPQAMLAKRASAFLGRSSSTRRERCGIRIRTALEAVEALGFEARGFALLVGLRLLGLREGGLLVLLVLLLLLGEGGWVV